MSISQYSIKFLKGSNMGKIKLSDELKLKIAQLTGLTYFAQNLEEYEDTQGEEVNALLLYYAPQQEQYRIMQEEIKPAIMKENPSIDFGDGTEPEPEDEVTFTITAKPEGCKVTINSEEQTSVKVKKGTEVTWKVEKEGYTTQEGTEEVNEDTTKDITLVAVPEKTKPTIAISLTELKKDEDKEFTVTITPNDYAGEKGQCILDIDTSKVAKLQNKVKDNWTDLPKNGEQKYYFGEDKVGFTIDDKPESLLINVNAAGELDYTITLVDATSKTELAKLTGKITVADNAPAKAEDLRSNRESQRKTK